jgi:hypothetical protein
MEGGLGTLLLERDVCETPLMMNSEGNIAGSLMKDRPGIGLSISADLPFQFSTHGDRKVS